MFNMKRVLLTAALVLSGALIAPLVAMATLPLPGTSFLTSNLNTGCTMKAVGGASITIEPDDSGGTWPFPIGNVTGGTSYEFRYIITSTGPLTSAINNVQIALDAKLPSPVTSDGTTLATNIRPPCKGAHSTNFINNFALDVCDAKVAGPLTVTIAANPGKVSLYMHDIKAHAPVGGASVKLGILTYSCSALEVPIDAPPAFANVARLERLSIGGLEVCIPLDQIGCPLKGVPTSTTLVPTLPYLCTDLNKTPLLEVTLTISDNVGSHAFQWAQGTTENAICPRGQINGNPPTCYLYSGGRTFKVC